MSNQEAAHASTVALAPVTRNQIADLCDSEAGMRKSSSADQRPLSARIPRPSSAANLWQEVIKAAAQQRDSYNFAVGEKTYKFPDDSLFIFSAKNPVRRAAVAVVVNPWFEYIVFLLVVVNSLILALADYSHVDENGRLRTEGSPRNQMLLGSEYFFVAAYAFEMVTKVIAMGFCIGEHAYLKDYWHWLDFAVVVLGFARFAPGVPNLSSLRIFRLFRPTRTTNTLSGLQYLVESFLKSIPQLLNMMVLVLFIFVIFGIAGLQLFIGPEMHARCRLTPFPVLRNWTVGLPFEEYRCLSKDNFNVDSSKASWNYENSPWHTARDCYWPVDEDVPRLCSFSSGQHHCYHNTDKIPESEWRWCGSNYDGTGNERFTAGVLDGRYYSKREFNKQPTFNEDLNWNLNAFDHIGKAFIIALQTITQEDWVTVMYMTQDAVSPVGGALYFALLLMFGAWFTINLMLAVLQENFQRAKAAFTTAKQEAEQESASGLKNLNEPTSMWSLFRQLVARIKTLPIWELTADDCLTGRALHWYLSVKPHIEKIATSPTFIRVMVVATFLNIVVLAMDHYPIDPTFQLTLDVLNVTFTMIFIVEMVVKLLALGVWEYCADFFNRVDGFIVIVSIIELAIAPPQILGGNNEKGGAFTAARILRVARFVKLTREWKGMQKLLESLGKSATEICNFGLLLFIFVYTYALLGMSLFANRLRFDEYGYPVGMESPHWKDAEVPRSNFDSFELAFTTVFQVLTGENWNEVFFAAYRGAGPTASVIYFVTLIVLGMFMFMSLFLAIVLNSFELEPQSAKQAVTQALTAIATFSRALRRNSGISSATDQSDAESVSSAGHNAAASEGRPTSGTYKPIAKPGIFPLNRERTLFIFGPRNRVRVACAKIISHPHFDKVILTLIVLSSITLAVDNPLDDPNNQTARALRVIDAVMTSIFALEMLMKIIATGLLFQTDAYLHDPWNVLDCVVVCLSAVSLGVRTQPGVKGLRAIRTLRALRPLRMIQRAEGLRVVVNAVLYSVPSVLNIGLVCLFFFLVFAIVGVNYFKGSMRACDGTVALNNATYVEFLTYPKAWKYMNIEEKSWFGPPSDIRNFSSCSVWPAEPCCGAWPNSLSAKPTSRQICECWHGDWTYVSPQHFDNVFQSMLTFFEMSTREGWVDVMFAAVDDRGVDMQPVRDHNLAWVWFFMLFMLLGAFLIMDLFVGAVVESFNEMRWQAGGSLFLTKKQQMWAKTQRVAMRVKPRQRMRAAKTWWKAMATSVVTHRWFEPTILICIAINTLFMMLEHFGQGSIMTDVIMYTNISFTFVYLVECVLKIVALERRYFLDTWNRVDFVVLLASIVGLSVHFAIRRRVGFLLAVVRIFRLFRLVKFLEGLDGMQQLFRTLIVTLPGLANVTGLLFLLFFIYAVIGVQLFATVAFHGEYNEQANFRTFGSAMLLLLRMATGENWNAVMHDIAHKTPNCVNNPDYNPNWCGYTYEPGCEPVDGCGNTLIYPYSISFMLLVAVVFINLVIGIILEGFSDSGVKDAVTLEHILDFTEHWSQYDPYALKYMRVRDLYEFVTTLPRPLGFKNTLISERRVLAVLAKSKLTIYQGMTVKFNDVLCALERHYVQGSGALSPEDIELVSRHMNRHKKRRHKALRNLRGRVYTSEQYYATQRIVSLLRQAAIMRNPHGACAIRERQGDDDDQQTHGGESNLEEFLEDMELTGMSHDCDDLNAESNEYQENGVCVDAEPEVEGHAIEMKAMPSSRNAANTTELARTSDDDSDHNNDNNNPAAEDDDDNRSSASRPSLADAPQVSSDRLVL